MDIFLRMLGLFFVFCGLIYWGCCVMHKLVAHWIQQREMEVRLNQMEMWRDCRLDALLDHQEQVEKVRASVGNGMSQVEADPPKIKSRRIWDTINSRYVDQD